MIEQGALTINGIQDIAATTIQKCWRGYAVRKAFENRKNQLMRHERLLKGKKRASAAEQKRTGDLSGNYTPRSVSPRYFKFFDIVCVFQCVFLHVFHCVFCVFLCLFLCVFQCVFFRVFFSVRVPVLVSVRAPMCVALFRPLRPRRKGK